MHGLSLHYYTVPGTWQDKGSSVEFDENEWFSTMKKTLYMEELVSRHSHIMDQYDPDKKVGLMVDEWGTWYTVEPGTNPGFLYQQNTMRDALVAGINLNIFNNHCDRVQMANIAQLVNVLQSVLLTEGEKMLLTPTYHVFSMFKVHQDAELVNIMMDGGEYRCGDAVIPQVSASASVDGENKLHISLCNLNPTAAAEFDCDVRGYKASSVTGTILTAPAMNAHNTFESTETVVPGNFEGAALKDGVLHVVLPPKSVTVLEIA
jgi:alpha-N-arabinofuranosidase